MSIVIDTIEEWVRTILVSWIMGNIDRMFNNLNDEVSGISLQVGRTPSEWNGGVLTMIENLSNTVIMPIAGMILTFVMCHELIQMIIDRNNLHDFPPSDIFKWIMKTFIAITLVSNTFAILLAIFDVAQVVVNGATGVILTDTDVGDDILRLFVSSLDSLTIGELMLFCSNTFIVSFIVKLLGICVFVIVYGRMIEIYLMISMGAIPIATMTSKEWNMGNNYIKSMLALGFQSFLIMVCVGIYAVLIQSIVVGGDPIDATWTCMGYTILLCFTLFKTGSLSKQIFSAH